MGGEALRTGNVASLRDALISLVSSPHTALRLCGVTENSASSRLFRHNVDNHPSPKSGGRRITGRGGAQRNPCDASTIRHRTPEGVAGTHKPTSCRPYGALCIIVPPFTGVPAGGLHPCLYSDVPSGDLRMPLPLPPPRAAGREGGSGDGNEKRASLLGTPF